MTQFEPLYREQQFCNARITYKKAPIHLLERYTFKNVNEAYARFRALSPNSECVILQTCNRVEIFLLSDGTPDGEKIIDIWSSVAGFSKVDFSDNVEISFGEEAILHLLRLTSGLDSLVIGEDQILGQVRRSYEFSKCSGHSNSTLSLIFTKALKVGSKVRTTTRLNKGNISIGSVAANIAERYFDDFKNRSILIIGSGEGASLVAKTLKQREVRFAVTSRTFERAKSFADTAGGDPIAFEDALSGLTCYDVVFVSTTAPYFLITYERISKAMSTRDKGMLVFDLSNPRTVEDQIATIRGIKLINMDQIAEIAENNLKLRKNEIASAEQVIDREVLSFAEILKSKRMEQLIDSVFRSVETLRQAEEEKAMSILSTKLGEDDRRTIRELSRSIVSTILSTPMNNLRKETRIGKVSEQDLIRIVERLFNYDDG
ncbi:MAG TPA: glutamyl-tRNA reductase [Nitrososphaeraceae archaeon]|jgi:glutamyl-tRNA reductase|nr:glutamyl-tRNA reductase [Nitrososphaeraceae archaeon]